MSFAYVRNQLKFQTLFDYQDYIFFPYFKFENDDERYILEDLPIEENL
jgi:hypothetical protein